MESGRLASELDVTSLKKAVAVTKHAQTFFYCLIACGARDTTALTIAVKPMTPAVVRVQQIMNKEDKYSHVVPAVAAQKRLAPAPRLQDSGHPATRHIKFPTAPQFDPIEKRLVFLRDTTNQYPFPSDIDCCTGFIYKGPKCPDPGQCTLKNIYRASSNVNVLKKKL